MNLMLFHYLIGLIAAAPLDEINRNPCTRCIVPEAHHYRMLHTLLSQHIEEDLSFEHTWINAPFHDSGNFNPISKNGGAQGCLYLGNARNYTENAFLSASMSELVKVVGTKLSSVEFPTADIIAMAGKVALESVYPCVRVQFNYGRSFECKVENKALPPTTLDSMEGIEPFLSRYGFSIQEYSLLQCGLKGMQHMTIPGFTHHRYIYDTDIKEYIRASLEEQWEAVKDVQGTNILHPLLYRAKIKEGWIWRTPSDMMYFPTSIHQATGVKQITKRDLRFVPTERYLGNLLKLPDYQLQRMFSRVYSKWLKMGNTASQSFSDLPFDHDAIGECKREPNFSLY
jgi:hypothetical protein